MLAQHPAIVCHWTCGCSFLWVFQTSWLAGWRERAYYISIMGMLSFDVTLTAEWSKGKREIKRLCNSVQFISKEHWYSKGIIYQNKSFFPFCAKFILFWSPLCHVLLLWLALNEFDRHMDNEVPIHLFQILFIRRGQNKCEVYPTWVIKS